MEIHKTPPLYEVTISARITLEAQSLSNAGSNGSNRLAARRQSLADGTETDAQSGKIWKHHHCELLTEYCLALGLPVCSVCKQGDGRRAGALAEQPDYGEISLKRFITECVICDSHGFLVVAKNAAKEETTGARERLNKDSLLEFSFGLGVPNHWTETAQIFTRNGEGQMIMKIPARSGQYAINVRYRCYGVGVDTEKRIMVVTDPAHRAIRHKLILSALRDNFLSPDGALTASMLPHFTGLAGIIMVQTKVGRAPFYSALKEDYINQLTGMSSDTCIGYPFESAGMFKTVMDQLIEVTEPFSLYKTI